MEEIKVYISNLSVYNSGQASGAWFTLPVTYEEVAAKIGLNESAEEYTIQDSEAPFTIDEYTSISELNTMQERYASIEDAEVQKHCGDMINDWFTDLEDLVDHQDDIQHYQVSSMSDLARDLVNEDILFGTLPDRVTRYLDYDAIARDLEIEGQYLITSDGIFEYQN